MTPGRLRGAVVAGLATAALVSPSPAHGQDDLPCSVTGYVAPSAQDLAELRASLDRPVQNRNGVPLGRRSTWVVPAGSRPVIVLESTEPLTGGEVWATFGGWRYNVAGQVSQQGQNQVVIELPELGSTTRRLGLTARTGTCEVESILAVDRGVWSTGTGIAAITVTFLCMLATVFTARRPTGGWLRRFGLAAPFALVAGLGQAALLQETGALSPFEFPWWAPLAGLGLAAVLPLTRRRRRPPGPTSPMLSRLGPYRIGGVVAGTAVARLYRATDRDDRPVLVKVALPGRDSEPAARLRLDREARALRHLEHPNVMKLRETLPGTGGSSALVFDDVDGVPVRDLLAAGGALPGPRATAVVLGVLAGLAATHGRELVHRDVRPENVWLTRDGRVVLGGFELACHGLENSLAPEGTGPYASPEQLAGRPLDPRSDLWACGVLLTELLTGEPLARRGSFDTLPEPMKRLVGRALAEDPDDRPTSADAFASELLSSAEQAYGSDWAGRAALGGALISHGAIGAAATGYVLGGSTLSASGTAPSAGVGAAISAGLGASETAGSAASVVSAAVPPATTAGAGSAAANVVAAVVVGVVAVGAVVVAPATRATAEPVVISPELARIIFVRTMGEALLGDDSHLAEQSATSVSQLLDEDYAGTERELTDVEVGVPPHQTRHPAWFVAGAAIRFEDATVWVLTRFDRESRNEPWLMSSFAWSTEEFGELALDEAGWLAPTDPAELAIDPRVLPEDYARWFIESTTAGEVANHPLLALRSENTFFAEMIAHVQRNRNLEISFRWALVEHSDPATMLLTDGTTLVWFDATLAQTQFNRPGYASGPCYEFARGRVFFGHYNWDTGESGDYRVLGTDWRVWVMAWLPSSGQDVEVLIHDDSISSPLAPERSVPC